MVTGRVVWDNYNPPVVLLVVVSSGLTLRTVFGIIIDSDENLC